MRLLFIFFLFSSTIANAQKFTSAIDYNDFIVDLQNQIGYKIIAFNDELGLEDASMASVTPLYEDLLKTTRDAIAKLDKAEVWEGNTELKASALALFQYYESAFSNEYKEMMGIVFKAEINEEDYTRLTSILESVTEKEQAFDLRFSKAQIAFADKYGFNLDRNELQDEIDGE